MRWGRGQVLPLEHFNPALEAFNPVRNGAW
jgi:hypothetical protein